MTISEQSFQSHSQTVIYSVTTVVYDTENTKTQTTITSISVFCVLYSFTSFLTVVFTPSSTAASGSKTKINSFILIMFHFKTQKMFKQINNWFDLRV